MVGEGVLLECLENAAVEKVLVVGRRACGVSHPKLVEIIPAGLYDLAPVAEQLAGYDACFFCLGTSSVGMTAEDYRRVTFDLTLSFGQTLAKLNPDMAFCYLTGMGTDSSEQGRSAWARVKGATENALLRLFKRGYMFCPGFMQAMPGQKCLKISYKLLAWVYYPGRALWPGGFCTLREVARAMICVATKGAPKNVLEVADIVGLAKGGQGAA